MRHSRKHGGLLATGLVLAILLVAWFQRQALYDWARLRSYQPPASIVQLANETTMASAARHIFFVQRPELDNKAAFSGHCGNQDEKTIVLGCYIPPQRGVYLLKVDDARLAGVEQVTAAHEMLHAAYDRLSTSDKNNVNKQIEQAYRNLTDQRIKTTIDAYKQAGADTANELHSIIGTEVRNLPPALETYYQRYFTNRSKVVAYSEQYQEVFTERKNKVSQYDAQLKTLKAQIDENENNLNLEAQALSNERLLVEKSNDPARINAYNQKVRGYNNKLAATNRLIDQFNQMVQQRNAIALEEQQLYQAIDSRLTPQATQ